MKFIPTISTSRNCTYSNPATVRREQFRFEVTRLADGKSAFVNRCPRQDSKFWNKVEFLVWDLTNNCQAFSHD